MKTSIPFFSDRNKLVKLGCQVSWYCTIDHRRLFTCDQNNESHNLTSMTSTNQREREREREKITIAQSITSAPLTNDANRILEQIKTNIQQVFNTTKTDVNKSLRNLFKKNRWLCHLLIYHMLTKLTGLLIKFTF